MPRRKLRKGRTLRAHEPEWEPLLNFAPDHVGDRSRYSVRQNVWPEDPVISFARSATKHRISRERSLYVIQRSGIQFIERRRSPASRNRPGKRIFLFGDDLEGVALEVVAAESSEDEFLAIHGMNLRAQFLPFYEEAKKWRK